MQSDREGHLAERQCGKDVAAAVRRREEADMSARVAHETRRQMEARCT